MEERSQQKENIFEPSVTQGHAGPPACIRDIFLHEDHRKAIFDQVCSPGSGGLASLANRMQKMDMGNLIVDTHSEPDIMIPEEIAQFLRKSLSWVYKNWRKLGGVKLGGSLFFPRKEDLYERLFGTRQGVEVRLHSERNQVFKQLVQNKNRSQGGGGKKKGGIVKTSADTGEAINRHGLLGACEQAS